MPASVSDLEKLRIDRGPDGPGAGSERPVRRAGASSGSRRLVLLAVALILALAGIGACYANRPLAVTTAVVETTGGMNATGSGAPAITASGYVVARTKASVAAKLSGRLAYLGVTEGSVVRKGQVIARIESAEYAAALAAARAEQSRLRVELVQAERELVRAAELSGRGVVPKTALEDAQTKVGSTRAGLQAAAANARLAAATLENTNVRAPFDGTVLRKDAEVGEIVAPSSAGGGLTRTAIATMADLGTLEVEVDVNEAYIARVTNGQAARITLDAYPDTSFAGAVRQVVPTADRQKATVLVKVAITDRDPRILPEMGARVDFVPAGQETAAAVPRRVWAPANAIDRTGGAPRVWTIEDGKATPLEVGLGAEDGARVEVRSGLVGGEQVIVAPPEGLKAGTKVSVKAGG
jgi:RND family efflux transporter MFP subunit